MRNDIQKQQQERESSAPVLSPSSLSSSSSSQSPSSSPAPASPMPAKRKIPPQPSSDPPPLKSRRKKETEKRMVPAIVPTSRKKKQGKQLMITLAPESRHVFKGMTFYFVPNNIAGSARVRRANKALEYGANCSNGWKEGGWGWGNSIEATTHIIADFQCSYESVLRNLNVDSIPERIFLVNENYPSDCLIYNRVLDPTQSAYEVPGNPATIKRLVSEPAVPKRAIARNAEVDGDITENEEDCARRRAREKEERSKSGKIVGDNDSTTEAGEKAGENEQAVAAGDNEKSITASEDEESHGNKGNAEKNKAKNVKGTTQSSKSPNKAQESYKKPTLDILDQIIEEAKKNPDLPIDEEEESGSSSQSQDSDSDERYVSEDERRQPSKKGKNADFQTTFQCMYKHDGESENQNPNERTIQVLSEMQKYYEMTGDHWRSLSYRKAIGTLKKQKIKIVFAEEAQKLPFIGERLAKKIEEIVFTNHLKRLEYAKMEPNDILLKLFLGVYGAGTSQAQRWIAAGYESLDDLSKKAKLTKNQKIGVEHYDDFNTRIPREEVKKHGDVVIKAAQEIDAELKLDIMGSYRRGAKDCGDIDIIITKPGATTAQLKRTLDKLLKNLYDLKFLQCTLATSHKDDTGSKWHGASQIEAGAPWRRLDLLLVPWKERGAALLYFTGNDIFNRSMRLLASKKGYRLNQRGLYSNVMRGPGRVKVTEGTLVEGESEEKIFEILGVPYRPPEHRIC